MKHALEPTADPAWVLDAEGYVWPVDRQYVATSGLAVDPSFYQPQNPTQATIRQSTNYPTGRAALIVIPQSLHTSNSRRRCTTQQHLCSWRRQLARCRRPGTLVAPFASRSLPDRDLLRLHVIRLRQFGQRPLEVDGGQHALALNAGARPARSALHGCLLICGILAALGPVRTRPASSIILSTRALAAARNSSTESASMCPRSYSLEPRRLMFALNGGGPIMRNRIPKPS